MTVMIAIAAIASLASAQQEDPSAPAKQEQEAQFSTEKIDADVSEANKVDTKPPQGDEQRASLAHLFILQLISSRIHGR